MAAAEDALADAFAAALTTWPERGVPDNPEGWLVTTARRKLVDGARRSAVRTDAVGHLILLAEERETEGEAVPDDRLKLLFVCAHPAIDESARTPLMLQTVLGLDAVRIASAFLVSPAAMGQRLVRAKAKIRDAKVPFEPPSAEEAKARLDHVLEAIYARLWHGVGGRGRRRSAPPRLCR